MVEVKGRGCPVTSVRVWVGGPGGRGCWSRCGGVLSVGILGRISS